jgi:hypothetical protein
MVIPMLVGALILLLCGIAAAYTPAIYDTGTIKAKPATAREPMAHGQGQLFA